MDTAETHNEILIALGQVPELVKCTNQILEDNDSLRKLAAVAMKQRLHVEVPETELQKIASVAAEAIAQTTCKLPDPALLSREVAKQTTTLFSDTIRAEAVKAVQEAVKGTPVMVEHHHTHSSLYEITQLAGKKAKRAFITLSLLVAVLSLALASVVYAFLVSDTHYGKRYARICSSPYISESEKEMLRHNIYAVSVLPKEYNKNPTLVKKRIKGYEKIIQQRKIEAKSDKGRYSAANKHER